MRTLLSGIATLALFGGVALAQTSGGSSEGQNAPAPPPSGQGTMGGHSMERAPADSGATISPQQVPYEATKHVAVVNAGLVDGATNANLLKQITAQPASYDQDHGHVFLTNIKQALTQAEAHLNHLKPLSTGKAATGVEAIQARLDRVKDVLPKMEGELANPKALGSDAGRVADQFRGGIAPLKDVSKALQAKVTVHSVG